MKGQERGRDDKHKFFFYNCSVALGEAGVMKQVGRHKAVSRGKTWGVDHAMSDLSPRMLTVKCRPQHLHRRATDGKSLPQTKVWDGEMAQW